MPHWPRAARQKVQSFFQRASWAPNHLASSCLRSLITTRSSPYSYILPGHLLQRPVKRSFFAGMIYLKLNFCSGCATLAYSCKAETAVFFPKGELGPKASCLQLFAKLNNNSLITVLLHPTGTSLTKACETQFLCRPDLAEVELQLWVCYIAQ